MPDEPVQRALDKFRKPADQWDDSTRAFYELLEVVAYGTERDPVNVQLELYVMLRHVKEMAEAMEKMAGIKMTDIAMRIGKIMQADGTEQLKAFGHSFTPDTETHVNCIAAKKEELLLWLKKHELGRELVKEDVHPKTLQSFVKKLQEDGKDIPPMVTTFDQPILKVRKLPSK